MDQSPVHQSIHFNKIDVHGVAADEVIFYQDESLLVSNRRIISGSTFNTRSISSVRIVALPYHRIGFAVVAAVLFGITVICWMAAHSYQDVAMGFYAVGIVSAIGGIGFAARSVLQRRLYAVMITTNARETTLIVHSNLDHLMKVDDAIGHALAAPA